MANAPATVTELAEFIKRMESDLGLLRDERYGFKARLAWESTRYPLQRFLERELLKHDISHTPKEAYREIRGLKRIRWGIRLLKNVLWHSWIRAPRRHEWLIYQHPRRSICPDGAYEDPYTDDLIREIPRRRRTVVEPHFHWQHFAPRRYRVWYTDINRLLSFLLRVPAHLSASRHAGRIRRMAADIEGYLSGIQGVQHGMYRLLRNSLENLIRDTWSSRIMLKWLRPRRILLVISYMNEGLILAARQMGVPTFEVQHGVITSAHLGYAVPAGTTKYSFPDYLLLWGRFWRDAIQWPVPPDRLVEIGFPFFERTRRSVENRKKQNRVVCISQGAIGVGLSRFFVDLAAMESHRDHEENRDFVYKLHPGEYDRWERLYPWLKKASDEGILTVVDSGKPALYELLATARWQIGVYSTALFEGLALGCRTYLVNLSGLEHMEVVVKRNLATVVSSPADINLTEAPPFQDRESIFGIGWDTRFRTFLAAQETHI